MNYKTIFFYILVILLISSCERSVITGQLEKEDKFTLSIGNLDNELDFFARAGIPFSLKSDIYMEDGIFYISNGNGKKIMKFNSYGDLLSKISPQKQSDSIPHDDSSWNFNEPGQLTKSLNNIFIVDSIEYETSLSENYIDKSNDTSDDKSNYERHILNEKIISIFDNAGNYINYIGQEGIGTKPFPFINNIYTNRNNNLIVVVQTTYFWSIYKFSETGELLSNNKIDLDYLPQLENHESVITQINNIIPDREKDRVLVELTYYKKYFDDKTDAVISMDTIKSRVYYYDLISNSYISWMDVPDHKSNNKDEQKIYSLLDIIQGKYLYFTSIGTDGITEYLTITNENGYVIGEYDLNIDNSSIVYKSFFTTNPSGILSGLLCTEYAAGITMWRSDKILLEDLK